jgi:tetratricopeptide (TPR) repeat protein
MKLKLVELVSQPSTLPRSSLTEPDPQTIENLQSLGYLQGGTLRREDLLQVENDLIAACQTGRDPKDLIEFSTLVDRGRRYLVEGQPEGALRVLKQAQKIDGEDISLLNALAGAYMQLRRPDAAIVIYQRLLEIKPGDAGALGSLARVHCAAGQPQRAVELLEKAIEDSPSDFMHHLNLANVYLEMRAYQLADREYETALELAPDEEGKKVSVRLAMAFALIRRARIDDARDVLADILERHPDYGPARDMLRRMNAPPQRPGG